MVVFQYGNYVDVPFVGLHTVLVHTYSILAYVTTGFIIKNLRLPQNLLMFIQKNYSLLGLSSKPNVPEEHTASLSMKQAAEPGGRLCHLVLQVSCFAYTSDLKMETVCSSKESDPLWTIWRYNTEVHILHSHCHENLRVNIY